MAEEGGRLASMDSVESRWAFEDDGDGVSGDHDLPPSMALDYSEDDDGREGFHQTSHSPVFSPENTLAPPSLMATDAELVSVDLPASLRLEKEDIKGNLRLVGLNHINGLEARQLRADKD